MTAYEMRTYTLHVGNMAEAVKLYTEFGYPALQKRGLGDRRFLGHRALGERGGPAVIAHQSQDPVQDPGEVCLTAPVERRRHGRLVRFRAGGYDLAAGDLSLPRRGRVAQRARNPGG